MPTFGKNADVEKILVMGPGEELFNLIPTWFLKETGKHLHGPHVKIYWVRT
jgi:hypothetical protein